ncbi:MAG: GNAT family N-acetyltransferase [Clostridium sp.]|uniref:GNAT family N-acetyltransferase n=1 Tax=Clostridium sp. TaxID=1506 RepID=UPI003F3A44B3
MNIDIKLENKELNLEEVCNLRFLGTEDLDKVLELQDKIMEWLDDSDLYSCSDREYFEDIIDNTGKIIGCFNENDELVGMGVYIKYGLDEHNYGHDINLGEEDLLKTAQIESTVVHKDYRGNKLQNIICRMIENLAIEDGMERIMATVSPKNPHSLNTFLNNGYVKELEKLKYSGLMRAILNKNLV